MNKKWMLVSCVIAGCAVGGVLVGRAFAATLGQCDSPTFIANADCDYPSSCAEDGCRAYTWTCSNGACDPAPCQARVPFEILLYGVCYNGYWDHGCVRCTKYWCARFVLFQTEDEYGECQQSRCTGITWRWNACVPT